MKRTIHHGEDKKDKTVIAKKVGVNQFIMDEMRMIRVKVDAKKVVHVHYSILRGQYE